MNQVANTVMIPRGEYEELKQHRDELLAALKDVLHTREQEAKAQRAYEVANENYSDPKPESEAWGNAMIEASMAEKRALAIIAKGGAMITRSSPEYLRGIDEPEAADLIKQQAERIKELEAAMPLYDELLIRCAIAEKDLTTLRQRIADAPIIVVNVGASYVLDRPGVYRLIGEGIHPNQVERNNAAIVKVKP